LLHAHFLSPELVSIFVLLLPIASSQPFFANSLTFLVQPTEFVTYSSTTVNSRKSDVVAFLVLTTHGQADEIQILTVISFYHKTRKGVTLLFFLLHKFIRVPFCKTLLLNRYKRNTCTFYSNLADFW
jgi:hypothetical protein